MNAESDIGEAVRQVRGEMPQATLAAEMVKAGHPKWSQSTVWSVEMGKRPLRLSEAESIAEICGAYVEDLLVDHRVRTVRFVISELQKASDELGFSAGRFVDAQDRASRVLRALSGAALSEVSRTDPELVRYWLGVSAPEFVRDALAEDGGPMGIKYRNGSPDAVEWLARESEKDDASLEPFKAWLAKTREEDKVDSSSPSSGQDDG